MMNCDRFSSAHLTIIYSGDLKLNLKIDVTDGPASLGTPSVFELTIKDNESPPPATEDLITNGGWEIGGVTAWKYTSTQAKRQCKGTGNGSPCALLLKPGLPMAVAYQDVPEALVPFKAGETLHFEFATKIGGSAKLIAMLKLKYVGGIVVKLKVMPLPLNTGGVWVTHSLDHSDATLSNVKTIRVQFRHGGGTGKVRVDDVVLQRLSTVMLPRGEINPLPVPPSDFRGGN